MKRAVCDRGNELAGCRVSGLTRFCRTKQKNVLRKQRNWERKLAAKRSKRKGEKLRRRQRRAEASGDHGAVEMHGSHSVPIRSVLSTYVCLTPGFPVDSLMLCILFVRIRLGNLQLGN